MMIYIDRLSSENLNIIGAYAQVQSSFKRRLAKETESFFKELWKERVDFCARNINIYSGLTRVGDEKGYKRLYPAYPTNTPQHQKDSIDYIIHKWHIDPIGFVHDPTRPLHEIDDHFYAQVYLCECFFSEMDTIRGRGSYSTYNLKHCIEKWANEYIGNAAAFVGAILSGFKVTIWPDTGGTANTVNIKKTPWFKIVTDLIRRP